MTGLFVTVTGWTIPQLNATPWPDTQDLLDYWFDNPPLHLMVKAYLGIEREEEEEHRVMDPAELAAWVQSLQR